MSKLPVHQYAQSWLPGLAEPGITCTYSGDAELAFAQWHRSQDLAGLYDLLDSLQPDPPADEHELIFTFSPSLPHEAEAGTGELLSCRLRWARVGEAAFITRCLSDQEIISLPLQIEGLPVTGLAADALAGLQHLRRALLPPSLTFIGPRAFKDCRTLSELRLPTGVRSLGAEALRHCSSLDKLELPDGLSCIGDLALAGLNWEHVRLPQALSHLGGWAFACSPRLTSVSGSCEPHCDKRDPFALCPSLKSVPDWFLGYGKDIPEAEEAAQSGENLLSAPACDDDSLPTSEEHSALSAGEPLSLSELEQLGQQLPCLKNFQAFQPLTQHLAQLCRAMEQFASQNQWREFAPLWRSMHRTNLHLLSKYKNSKGALFPRMVQLSTRAADIIKKASYQLFPAPDPKHRLQEWLNICPHIFDYLTAHQADIYAAQPCFPIKADIARLARLMGDNYKFWGAQLDTLADISYAGSTLRLRWPALPALRGQQAKELMQGLLDLGCLSQLEFNSSNSSDKYLTCQATPAIKERQTYGTPLRDSGLFLRQDWGILYLWDLLDRTLRALSRLAQERHKQDDPPLLVEAVRNLKVFSISNDCLLHNTTIPAAVMIDNNLYLIFWYWRRTHFNKALVQSVGSPFEWMERVAIHLNIPPRRFFIVSPHQHPEWDSDQLPQDAPGHIRNSPNSESGKDASANRIRKSASLCTPGEFAQKFWEAICADRRAER